MNYRNLNVWKKSMELLVNVYKMVRLLPAYELYALSDQIRRAAVSIPSNIAEGASRESDKDFKRFLYIARGSAAELETQCLICISIGYVKESHIEPLLEQIALLKSMLSSLIKRLK